MVVADICATIVAEGSIDTFESNNKLAGGDMSKLVLLSEHPVGGLSRGWWPECFRRLPGRPAITITITILTTITMMLMKTKTITITINVLITVKMTITITVFQDPAAGRRGGRSGRSRRHPR